MNTRQTDLTVRGLAIGYLLVLVVIPILAMVGVAFEDGFGGLMREALRPQALAAVWLTVWMSVLATLINLFAGVMVAWTLVRKEFPGKKALDALIDLPLAIPALVAGIVIVSLYGPQAFLGAILENNRIEVLFARPGILLALLFVTLPLVVRTVQPVIEELEPEVEQAAHTLGASKLSAFMKVTLPGLVPAIATAGSLCLARALGEFGSLVLIAGNVPFRTEVAPTYVFSRIESGRPQAAAAVALLLLVASVFLLLVIELLQARLGARVRAFLRRKGVVRLGVGR